MISMSRHGWATAPSLVAALYLTSAFPAEAQITSLLSNATASKASTTGTSAPSTSDPSKYDPSKYDPWASARPAEPADDAAEATDEPVDASHEADTSHDEGVNDVDVDKLDWSQLNADASTLTTRQPGKARSASTAPANPSPNWSS